MTVNSTGAAPAIANVLAGRYASPEMRELWSPEGKVMLERRLWIAVLTAQAQLGMAVPDGVIADYESVVEAVDLASIDARERITRHDVKARIEEFSALAGHEYIHAGMTSRDLTENVEQLQLRRSMELLADRALASLARLATLAAEHRQKIAEKLASLPKGAIFDPGAYLMEQAGQENERDEIRAVFDEMGI